MSEAAVQGQRLAVLATNSAEMAREPSLTASNNETLNLQPTAATAEPVSEVASQTAGIIVEPARISNPVLDSVSQFERRFVGTVEYEPKKLLLKSHELHYNCVLQVCISQEHLNTNNDKRELWGTEVYTDDSDLVCVLRHLGHTFSNEDLCVDLLILPQLRAYQGSLKSGLVSRSWDKHDGISYMVLNIKSMPQGWCKKVFNTQTEDYVWF